MTGTSSNATCNRMQGSCPQSQIAVRYLGPAPPRRTKSTSTQHLWPMDEQASTFAKCRLRIAIRAHGEVQTQTNDGLSGTLNPMWNALLHFFLIRFSVLVRMCPHPGVFLFKGKESSERLTRAIHLSRNSTSLFTHADGRTFKGDRAPVHRITLREYLQGA